MMILFKTVLRKIATVIVLLIFVSLSAGCAKDSGNTQGNEPGTIPGTGLQYPEFVYISEIIPFPELPESFINITNVFITDETVYFTARNDSYEGSAVGVNGLFSMDVDGFNLVKLPNYVGTSFLTDKTVSVDALHVDKEGYLWILESSVSYESDQIEFFAVIRKLDNTGFELLAFDLSDIIVPGSAWFHTPAIKTDDTGNIYFASAPNIHVFDNNGGLLFSLNDQSSSTNLIWLSDGTVALSAFSEIGTHLKKIDTKNKTWGEIITLSSESPIMYSVFSGSEKYLFLYNDKSYLTGVIAETGEQGNVLNWIDSTLSSEDINSVRILPDGRIAATRLLRSGTLPVTELILLTKSSGDDLSEKIVLTYGTFSYDSDQSYVVELFNRNSETHYIQVKNYSVYNTDEDITIGLLKLTTEMITGNAPDILDVWILPVHNYSSKGFLLDLYPFIDADPELARSDFIASVLKALETGDSLYRISPSFIFNSIVGNPSVLGSYPGWNMDEFIAVLAANPQADKAFGYWTTDMNFLSMLLVYNWDEYFDRTTGTAYFDSEKFIDLLEMAKKFPSDFEHDPAVPGSAFGLSSSGRQIMDITSIGTAEGIEFYRTMFGGEIVYKGFPNEHRDGNSFTLKTSIAITTYCNDVDAAWEFVRMFLSEDYQRDFTPRSLPLSKVVFEERLDRAMNPIGDIGTPPTQEEIDMFRDAINNTSRLRSDADATLWAIVTESAADFFNGQITAFDAARIIQNRATIYIAEQN